MSDPIHRLRSTGPVDSGSFPLDDIHARLGSSIHGQGPGVGTRRRRTAIGGGLVGGVAAAGLAIGLVLTGGPGHADSNVPTIAITDGIAGGGDPSIQVRPASWYADRATEAIDEIDLSRTILRTETTSSSTDPVNGTMNDRSTHYLAGDGTASLDDIVAEGSQGVVIVDGVDARQLIDADGTMEYTIVDRQSGEFSVFPWSPDNYVDDRTPPVQEQIKDHVAEIKDSTDLIATWEENGIEPASRESAEIDGVAATCLVYETEAGEPGAVLPDGSPVPEAGVVESGSSRLCFDAERGLPLIDETTQTIRYEDGTTATMTSSTSYGWLDDTEENRALLVPDTDGLRQVEYDH